MFSRGNDGMKYIKEALTFIHLIHKMGEMKLEHKFFLLEWSRLNSMPVLEMLPSITSDNMVMY